MKPGKEKKQENRKMAYSELIKDFSRIRSYLRCFYVYGFQHRDDFTRKSARSYDNERRRIESWLGGYLSFRQDENGRRMFFSVDSRQFPRNPLYRAFKTKSFTGWDIALHFYLLAILNGSDPLAITAIADRLSEMLSCFENEDQPDESTVRKKLKEYAGLGLVVQKKRGRETVYELSRGNPDLGSWREALSLFAEVMPLGVIGSFIQDRLEGQCDFFRFKHHYILNALDSEVIFEILRAIHEKRLVSFVTADGHEIEALPFKLYIGTQTGRQYALVESRKKGRFFFQRADFIEKISVGDFYEEPPDLKRRLEYFRKCSWGVSGSNMEHPERIEMVIQAGPDEEFVVQRLMREKRSGLVERIDECHWKFSAEVYDPMELLPWLRSFIGRITDISCTREWVVSRFYRDFADLSRMYGVGRYDFQ